MEIWSLSKGISIIFLKSAVLILILILGFITWDIRLFVCWVEVGDIKSGCLRLVEGGLVI